MPRPDIDHAAFAAARARVAAEREELVAVRTELAELSRRRAHLLATGAGESGVADTVAAIRDAARRREDLAARIDDARVVLDDLADGLLDDVIDPGRLVEELDGDLPIVLLPVRLETRFTDDASALRVRIFPDQLHLDAHDPELTPSEVEAGAAYWRAVWSATGEDDEPVRAAAWAAVTTDVAATRGRWVVDAMTPTNLDARESDPEPVLPTPTTVVDSWVRPVRATALPDRWLAIGQRGGRTIVRGWSRHVPDELPVTPTPGAEEDEAPDTDGVPVDPDLRWLTDFAEAEKVGMAMTLSPDTSPGAVPTSLSQGLDTLLVVGVDWTLEPEEAASRLADLFDGHRYADGLAHLPPGTPTNQTSSTPSWRVAPTGRDADSLRPDVVVGLPADARSGADRLQAALGLQSTGLRDAPGAGSTATDTSLLLQDVIWPATLGHYLDDMLAPAVGDDMIAFARAFVAEHLVPGGPLPAVRVGPQPYGFLPCVAAGSYSPPQGSPLLPHLFRVVQDLRGVFRTATSRLPRMGASDDPGDDLLPLLQRGPVAQSARFRHVQGPAWWHNISQPEEGASSLRYSWVAHLAWSTMLGVQSTFLAGLTPEETSYRLPVPWVQAGPLSRDGMLDPDYLTAIADLLEGEGGRDQLVARQNAETLLEALVAAAATEELDRRVAELAAAFRVDVDEVGTARRATLAPTEVVGVVPVTAEVPEGAVRIETHEQLANVRVDALTGQRTLADHVTVRLHDSDAEPPVRAFGEYVDRVRRLAGRPTAELDLAFRGFLDATSHRLDAWFTALATERLAELRARRPEGVHIGGWGWVEDLRPDPRPDSLGYVHTPSLAHATTAALLRSGHLTHRDPEDRDRFDMQLTSRRIGPARSVLEGVARGQQLGALLGYRLERAIHEDELVLAQFILPLRRLAPLDGRDPDELPPGATEAIAARDVVDGLRLLERWRDEGTDLFDRLDPSPDADARTALAGHLDRLDQVHDTVGDILVAEAVHQAAQGNHERAGAALAALDRQEPPPEPDVLATPRTGTRWTQRVGILLTQDGATGPWRAPTGDVRAAASPRIDAWVAGLLPTPSRVRFAGRLRVGDGDVTELTADARDLDVSALSLVAAARAGSAQQPSELDQRVVAALVDGVDLPAEGEVQLEVLDEPPAGSGPDVVGLAALRAHLEWIGRLLGRARPLRVTELALPAETATDTVDVDELAARADLVGQRLDEAVDALAGVVGDEAADVGDLEAALLAGAAVGADGAMPPVGTGDPAAHRTALVEQANRVLDALRRRQTGLADLAEAHAAADPPPVAEARVAHHVARIQHVLGSAFTVVGQVAFDGDRLAAVEASLKDDDALTDGNGLAARRFVDRMAPVRPDLQALADVLVAAELLDATEADPTAFVVAQLPHVPGQRWAALPRAQDGPAAEPDLALLLHHDARGQLRLDRPLAGLVVDEWVESLPSAEETTALAFHYDAPAARAPQAVLLAVPGDPGQEHWTADDLVATVREAMELAQLRGLTPDELPATGQFLPMTYLPHRFTRDQKPPPLSALLEHWSEQVVAAGVIGKLYLDEE